MKQNELIPTRPRRERPLRVLFMGRGGAAVPSTRVRALQFMEPLRQEGIESRAFFGYRVESRIQYMARLLPELLRCDLVYCQKILPSRFVLNMIRRLKRKLVFDFDDPIQYAGPATGDQPRKQAELERLFAILEGSDGVIVGNSNLRTYALQYNQNVISIPSVVDTDVFCPPSPGALRDDTPIVGWIGTADNLRYIESLDPVLREVAMASQCEFTLRVVSSAAPRMHYPRLDFVPWKLSDEQVAFQALDIGLMPLVDNEWTRGKCGYKAIQYMACGVATLASPVGMLRELIEHGVNGFLCDGKEEWSRCLTPLLSDRELRDRVGCMGRESVEEQYSMRHWTPVLAGFLRSCAASTDIHTTRGTPASRSA